MAREVNLTSEDLAGLEQELTNAQHDMFAEQKAFLQTLVNRARAGSERSQGFAAHAPGWLWTWTYRF